MKSARVSLCSAIAAVTMVCASALPASAVSYTLNSVTSTSMLIGDDANFSAGGVAVSPLSVGWFFDISQPAALAVTGGTNTPGNLGPMTLAIWQDTNLPASVDALDTLVASVSGGPNSPLNTLLSLVTVLTSPGNYYVRISGPFTTATSGSVSGTLGLSEVPLPPAVILFGTALAGLGILARRRRKEHNIGAIA